MVSASALWNGIRKSSIHSQANRKPADFMQFETIQNARKTKFFILPKFGNNSSFCSYYTRKIYHIWNYDICVIKILYPLVL